MTVALRPPMIEDIECFHEIFSDKETHHFIIDEGLQDLEGSKKKLAKLIEINGQAKLAFTILDESSPVGFIVVHLDQTESPFISYAIRRKFWGRGLASEAILKLKEKEGFRFKAFKAATHLENLSSQKVLKKSNFEEVGTRELSMGIRKLFLLKMH